MTPEQFNSLFRSQLPEITRFIARRVSEAEVEDLASDLFEIAWQKREQIPLDFELPWLYRTARNLIANQRRKSANRSRIFAQLNPVEAAPSAESLALADLELAAAWQALKPADREILALWAFESFTTAQLAVALKISEGNAAVRLSRAKKQLAEKLQLAVNTGPITTSN